jgi:hypothetical protein
MKTDLELRQDILVAIQASTFDNTVPGDAWFGLVFRTRAQLIQIAHELNVQVTK